MPVSVTVTALIVRPGTRRAGRAQRVERGRRVRAPRDWASAPRDVREHFSTGWPRRNATVPASAQPLMSEVSTEWPTPGTASSWASGYCAAVRRASSSGVRRSARPERTSTGTSGPA